MPYKRNYPKRNTQFSNKNKIEYSPFTDSTYANIPKEHPPIPERREDETFEEYLQRVERGTY